MPDVTFLVIAFNRAPFLPHVLDGIARDEGAFSREVVLVDDGSTDGTAALLRGHVGLRVHTQANQGPAAALAAGARLARGKWIRTLDSDDIPLPWGTEMLLNAALRSGVSFAFADSRFQPEYVLGPIGLESVARLRRPEAPPRQDVLNLLPLSLRHAQTLPSTWLVRRDILQSAIDTRVFIQDYAAELRLALSGLALRLHAPVVARGSGADQLSRDTAQTLHDLNAALLHFLADTPALPTPLLRFARKRAAGRAWRWALRHAGMRARAAAFVGLMESWAGLPVVPRRLLAPFDEPHPVRRPDLQTIPSLF